MKEIMKKKKRIFIGVAWPYVNGELHIGHLAGYLLPADIFARFQRLIGNEVLMVSGSDCHGTPITLEAEKRKLKPKDIVNLYHPKHKELFKLYHISFDIYTKTTKKNHKKVVQDLFLKLLKKGYIFKKKSWQYFDQKSKRFLPDRYVEGICPYCHFEKARGDQCEKCARLIKEGELKEPKSKISANKVKLKQTEHYYFDLPKFKNFLENYLNQKGSFWRPWVFKEAQNWLKKLEPRAISRDLEWGVKIPKEKIPKKFLIEKISKKRIYVWFEAVVGYLSASIEWAKNSKKWRKFWYSEESLHYYFMGKDNLVFHALFWPAQLYGAFGKIHLPDFLVVSQFLNFEGKPFSKSRGIFVGAKQMGEKFNPEAIRFYLCLILPENSDTNFSWKDFEKVNNNILIGTFSNFIHRTLKLFEKSSFFEKKGSFLEPSLKDFVEKKFSQIKENLQNCKFRAFAQELLKIAKFGNSYIDQKAPWRFEKNSLKFQKIMTNLIFLVLALALFSKPLLPQTSKKLSHLCNFEFSFWPEKNLSHFLEKSLKKVKVKKVFPLFEKIFL